ncbi:hypothetical protein EXE30_01535 [Acinetobacter halotolerans]|uniref:Uncharacterized protein n=2 Tax=Acinetobacter halotolerans TaxID=1752076 RepID=A0A4Q6XFC5_9GAMM|nr:hypothetical protein [Acinetobacter halotolerans]RZF56963.1 hypothetical protein EXE30_01535 [Acinetobacter halotolerans]
MKHSNNHNNSSSEVDQDLHLKRNKTDATKPDVAEVDLMSSDKLSYQQVEGLTNSDDLQEEMKNADIPKNPENALQEEGAEREHAIQSNDGSHGNEKIRKAVENLDSDEMRHNLKDEGDDTDQPSQNPAPFITPK